MVRSHSIFSILSLGLLLLVIFGCWVFAAQSLYVSLFGSTPPESFIQFVTNIFGTPQGWKLIGFGTGIGFVFAVVALSMSVVSFPLLIDRESTCRSPLIPSGRIENPVTMALWGSIVTSSWRSASCCCSSGSRSWC